MLTELFLLGSQRCHPKNSLPDALSTIVSTPKGKTIVLGAGKAAAEMAAVAVQHLTGTAEGAVVTRYGYGENVDTGAVEVIRASHPVPDNNSILASQRILEKAMTATADDHVVFLVSGGGSALLCSPCEGITLDEKKAITKSLVLSGASITDINLVRKNLSKIKGGRLASSVSPARLSTYIISDVVGDDPADIASGPTVYTAECRKQALDILAKYNIAISNQVKQAILNNSSASDAGGDVHVVAKNMDALRVIAENLNGSGRQAIILGDAWQGNASEIGRLHAQEINIRCKTPGLYALISGGELTVEVRNSEGKGGPNLEYLMGLMLALDTPYDVEAIACDSDGIDGSQDNAGGYINSTSLARAKDASLDVEEYLATNNSYELFRALGDLIVTGPTGTNVNDIRIILVDSREN